jgi:hypothetical protein
MQYYLCTKVLTSNVIRCGSYFSVERLISWWQCLSRSWFRRVWRSGIRHSTSSIHLHGLIPEVKLRFWGFLGNLITHCLTEINALDLLYVESKPNKQTPIPPLFQLPLSCQSVSGTEIQCPYLEYFFCKLWIHSFLFESGCTRCS